jgi:peptidoglycan/LPS O-acetylase OafA/YrhL
LDGDAFVVSVRREQFYFAWPGVLRRWYRHRVALLLGVVALVPLYSAGFYYFKVHSGGYGTFPAVADNLAIGCLLAIFGSRIPQIRLWAAIPMVLAVLLIPSYPANTPIRTLFMLFVLWPILHCSIAGLVLLVMQSPYRILNLAPLVWLGRISYSLYLWQEPFFSSPLGSQRTNFFLASGWLVFPTIWSNSLYSDCGTAKQLLRQTSHPRQDWLCAKLCDDLSMPFAPVVVT